MSHNILAVLDRELDEVEAAIAQHKTAMAELDLRKRFLTDLRHKVTPDERAYVPPAGRATTAEPQPGKVEAPRPAVSTGAAPKLMNIKERSLIALLEKPMKTGEIAELFNVSTPGVSVPLRSNEHLFKKMGGMFSPWTLTPEGKETAERLKREAARPN